MGKPSAMNIRKTNDLCNYLKDEAGFELSRQTGSHLIYKNDDGQSVSIPNQREIAPGTLRQVLKTAGLYK